VKVILKISTVILFLVVSAYYLYFYISPNVSVINQSENRISNINVRLTESNMDFGSLEPGETNTIYYSLFQKEGSYQYSIEVGDERITGFCGYITKYEFNKRFVVSVSKRKQVSCEH